MRQFHQKKEPLHDVVPNILDEKILQEEKESRVVKPFLLGKHKSKLEEFNSVQSVKERERKKNNIAGGGAGPMMALETHIDNLCLWRCIAGRHVTRPYRSTKTARVL